MAHEGGRVRNRLARAGTCPSSRSSRSPAGTRGCDREVGDERDAVSGHRQEDELEAEGAEGRRREDVPEREDRSSSEKRGCESSRTTPPDEDQQRNHTAHEEESRVPLAAAEEAHVRSNELFERTTGSGAR